MPNKEEYQDSQSDEEQSDDLEKEEADQESEEESQDDQSQDDEGQDDELSVEELQERNKQLYARAKKAEGKLKDESKKEKEELKKSESEEEAPQKGINVDMLVDLQSQGFSSGEIKQLNSQAKSMGVNIKSLMKNETYMKGFKAGIDEEQKKENAQKATPSPSGSGTTVSGKDWNKMDKKEKEKNYQSFVRKKLNK